MIGNFFAVCVVIGTILAITWIWWFKLYPKVKAKVLGWGQYLRERIFG